MAGWQVSILQTYRDNLTSKLGRSGSRTIDRAANPVAVDTGPHVPSFPGFSPSGLACLSPARVFPRPGVQWSLSMTQQTNRRLLCSSSVLPRFLAVAGCSRMHSSMKIILALSTMGLFLGFLPKHDAYWFSLRRLKCNLPSTVP